MTQPATDPPQTPLSHAPKTALERALAAIAADPKRSLRDIAAEIGVSHQTVARAAQHMKAGGDVTGADVTAPHNPRDPMAYVTKVLARSKGSPRQKASILRAMERHFNRRRR